MTFDPLVVQELWEASIEAGIYINNYDPYYANNQVDWDFRMGCVERAIIKAVKGVSKPYSFNKEPFRSAPHCEQQVMEHLYRFESRMTQLKHATCDRCHECRIGQVVTQKGSLCSHCQRKETANNYSVENAMLPVWIDEVGMIHYEVPRELSELSIAEVLLIQRVAPLVPLVHIRNGTLGIKGHVCSFMQNINEVAKVLPRLPSNVKAVKMVRTYAGSNGEDITRTFIVNRRRVMRALCWLVSYHSDYKTAYQCGDLIIDATNLSWMGEQEEADLPSVATMIKTFASEAEARSDQEQGVSAAQSLNPEVTTTDEIECSGIVCEGETALTSEVHDKMMQSLKDASDSGEIQR